MVDRRHRELTAKDIKKITDPYHAWRNEPIDGQQVKYQDVAGFCKAVKLDEIRKQGHILTPGRYVGTEEEEDNPQDFEERIKQLTDALAHQMVEAEKLDREIRNNLGKIGYGF
jgi:type I restriction enzyme M protein